MIIHCSGKLAAKLPDCAKAALTEDSPIGSWHGHLFTVHRYQCVMFCHDASRWCLFLPGLRKPHFADLGSKWFRQLYRESLAASGFSEAAVRKAELALGPVRFDRATDRSVTGTINTARSDLANSHFRSMHVLDINPAAVSTFLSRRPVQVRGKHQWPDEVMREVIDALP